MQNKTRMQNKTKKFLRIICMMICIVVMAIQPVFADTTSSPVTVINGNERTVTVDEGSTIILDQGLTIQELVEQDGNTGNHTKYFKIERTETAFHVIITLLIFVFAVLSLIFTIYSDRINYNNKKRSKKY